MIASLDSRTAPFKRIGSHYVRFIEDLRARGFEGEIAPDYANRTVLATDNSIYQRLPQAAVFPKHAEDLERLAKLADGPKRVRVLAIVEAAAGHVSFRLRSGRAGSGWRGRSSPGAG